MTQLSPNSSTNRRLPAIGDLRHQISLLAPMEVDDGAGGAVVTYALEALVFADIRFNSGQSRLTDDRLSGSVSISVWIRYRDGLTPDHRFAFGPRTFLIRAVLDHDGRNRFQECLCDEVVT